MEEESSKNVIIVGLFIGLLVVLSLVLVWVALPPMLIYIRRKMPVSQKRIDLRYRTIDGWLISKRVRPHDECCDMLISEFAVDPQKYCRPCTDGCSPCSSSSATATSLCACHGKSSDDFTQKRYKVTTKEMLAKLTSLQREDRLNSEKEIDRLNKSKREDDPETQVEDIHRETGKEEEDGSESTFGDDNDDDLDGMNKRCGICLEKFKVGEAVSWSCDEGCQHVFHHECLRNWLLRRIRCPYCRTIVLPVDKSTQRSGDNKGKRRLFGGAKFTRDELRAMSSRRANYLIRTYFCVEKGLVVLQSMDDEKKSIISSTSHTSATDLSENKVTKKPSSSSKNRNSSDGNDDNVWNTTQSLCSEDTFGEADSAYSGTSSSSSSSCGKSEFDDDGNCGVLRMSSSSTDSFGSAFSDDDDYYYEDDDLEAPDGGGGSSYSQSAMEHDGFISSCRTNDDDGDYELKYDGSQRSSSSSSDVDLVSSQRTEEHNGEGDLDIVRLDV